MSNYMNDGATIERITFVFITIKFHTFEYLEKESSGFTINLASYIPNS
jgi:hypothetical protein